MCIDPHINEQLPLKRGLDAFANSIGSDQPAQSAQADLGRNFLLLVNFRRTILARDVFRS